MAEIQENKEIKKSPHYFMVYFEEYYTSVNGGELLGKYYTKFCDGFAVNVYGFKDDAEAEAFDPKRLRGLLRGSRTRKFLWKAESEAILRAEIAEDKDVKNGSMRLAENYLYGPIENFPECSRMHEKPDGELLCGEPIGKYNDGCLGGCVLQGYDQEFDPEFFICPVQKFWAERFEKRRKGEDQKAA